MNEGSRKDFIISFKRISLSNALRVTLFVLNLFSEILESLVDLINSYQYLIPLFYLRRVADSFSHWQGILLSGGRNLYS